MSLVCVFVNNCRMPQFNILLINTRVPRSTKQLVEGVRQRHNKVWNQAVSQSCFVSRAEQNYSSWPRGQAWEYINAVNRSNGLHHWLYNPYIASERHRWRQVPQRPSLVSSQSLHRQRAHSSALTTWLGKGPVCNGGSAVHWPFSVASSIPTPYRTPGLCDLPHCNGAKETAEHLVFQCPAHDQALRQTWPDQRVIYGSTTSRELSGADWGSDPPLNRREREREREPRATSTLIVNWKLIGWLW